MSDKARPRKKVISKPAKKKGRFGGGPVRLYSDPLVAFRAFGAKVCERELNSDGSFSWNVSCPFHEDREPSATLTERNDDKWQFTCRAFNCGSRSGENKLEMLSDALSLVVSDFIAESDQELLNKIDFWSRGKMVLSDDEILYWQKHCNE